MGIPWWLASHDSTNILRVLRKLDTATRVQFEGADADIVLRLFRNRYVRGEVETTVIGYEGPIAIEIESKGLTDLGSAMLTSLGAQQN
jgi:hypothetical protein